MIPAHCLKRGHRWGVEMGWTEYGITVVLRQCQYAGCTRWMASDSLGRVKTWSILDGDWRQPYYVQVVAVGGTMPDEKAAAPADPETEPLEQVASYQVRVLLRRQPGQNLDTLTLEEIRDIFVKPLTELGYAVSVRAERLDI